MRGITPIRMGDAGTPLVLSVGSSAGTGRIAVSDFSYRPARLNLSEHSGRVPELHAGRVAVHAVYEQLQFRNFPVFNFLCETGRNDECETCRPVVE